MCVGRCMGVVEGYRETRKGGIVSGGKCAWNIHAQGRSMDAGRRFTEEGVCDGRVHT